jgi:hypothetical protein
MQRISSWENWKRRCKSEGPNPEGKHWVGVSWGLDDDSGRGDDWPPGWSLAWSFHTYETPQNTALSYKARAQISQRNDNAPQLRWNTPAVAYIMTAIRQHHAPFLFSIPFRPFPLLSRTAAEGLHPLTRTIRGFIGFFECV